jgi:hypothetical protein
MKNTTKINFAIVNVTGKIEEEFPEYYKNLLETPLFLSNEKVDNTKKDFIEYLESISLQLLLFEKEKHQLV